jgi:ABC-2 type transport system permease protein
VAESIGLYWRLVRTLIRAQLQYRTQFAIVVAGMFLASFLDFAAILIIFGNVPALGGWSVREVALLYGISALSFALTDLVIGHFDGLGRLIRDGTFDLLLVRPRGTLFQVVASDFQLRRVGKIAQGVAVLAFALAGLDIAWTPARAAVLALAIPSGAVIFGAVWVAVICISFWTIESSEAANANTYGGQYLSQFPINIYDRWVRRLLAYVFPMAFVAYFPALFILGKPDPLGLPGFLQVASPAVAVVASLVAARIWQYAVRHYQSAGG